MRPITRRSLFSRTNKARAGARDVRRRVEGQLGPERHTVKCGNVILHGLFPM